MELARDADETMRVTKELCKQFVNRATKTEMSGEARDYASFEYILGAACLAHVLGDSTLAANIGTFGSKVVNKHGYESVVTMAEMPGDTIDEMSAAMRSDQIKASKTVRVIDGGIAINVTNFKRNLLWFLIGAVSSGLVFRFLA